MPTPFLWRQTGDDLIADLHFSAVGFQLSADEIQKSGFAGCIGSDDTPKRTQSYTQIEAIDHHSVVERLA
jgi:hypothetical protein